ncbi:MAG: hypothetical protein LWX02_07270 [Deltaproteobacteria bacterium]|jgi:uncharacterized protein YjbI with pentapeptide repeats|nr:hypothetical protein [Deltaproteobacteria bacterium]MDL1987587.1 hypothetical protein [Deltaproteobacteria bacterium]
MPKIKGQYFPYKVRNMKECQYANSELPDYKCKRECHAGSHFCVFHTSEEERSETFPEKFCDELNKLHESKDGDWVGFIFPKTYKLAKLEVDYDINLSYSTFGKIEISEGTFHNSLNLDNCFFKDDSSFHCTFDGSTNFSKCIFWGRTRFGGNFNHDQTNFGACTFHDAITFLGGYDITFNCQSSNTSEKIRRLFINETDMRDINFYRPERVKFVGVDMSKLLLLGTDLSGVHLYDTKWFQEALSRNGLRDEIWVHRTNGKEFQKYFLPRIESQYRNVRVALEANKNFTFASDFYIGEMEIRRKKLNPLRRYFFSIEAFYNALSQYGANPIRASRILLYFFLIHVLLSIYFQQPEIHFFLFEKLNLESLGTIFSEIIKYSINSLKVLTLQRFGTFIENGIVQSLIDTFFRLIGPFQIALFVMSMRNRIKRN